MAESISILKKSLADHPRALDFDFLNTEGIRYLQQLAGKEWTDFNEHDPGVTILEQLCYAITDLAYRADFDIRDIVATGRSISNSKGKEGLHTFYTASEALTCNPVTITDLNKLLIDRVKEIVHAWVQVAKSNDGYDIYVEVKDEHRGDKGMLKKIEEKIRKEMNACRSLCEKVKDIIIYEPQDVTLIGDIDLEDTADVNEVLGNIFYRVFRYLSSHTRFYTLPELLDEGRTVEEIFRGPALQRGFIKSEEMTRRRSEIQYSKLTAVILDVQGVKSVRTLKLDGGDAFQLCVQERKIAVLSTDPAAGPNPYQLQLFKGNIRYRPDPEKVTRRFRTLRARNTRQYSELPLSQRDTRRPEGRARDISYYHSIQNNFPGIYGINKGGIPASYPERRKIQAKQLKSYLLFFEQVLADYLAQLEHAGYLFSIDKEITQTYFHRDFFDRETAHDPLRPSVLREIIPDLVDYKLLVGENKDSSRSSASPKTMCFTRESVPKDYKAGMENIVSSNDDFTGRRNRMANHLLARFGERVTSNSLIEFNVYYPGDKAFRTSFINYKLDFLKSVPALGANRAKAADVSQNVWGKENRAGLEKRVSLLLGINDSARTFSHTKHSLTDAVLRENIWFRKERYAVSGGTDFIRQVTVDMKEEEIRGFIEMRENDSPAGTVSLPGQQYYHRPKRTYVDEDILRGGFDISRYRYGQNVTDIGQGYIAVFDLKENRMWRRIGEYDSKEEAEDTIRYLVNYVRRLNLDSEGFHLVEHHLLKTREQDSGTGVELTGSDGSVLFRSAFRYDNDLFRKIAEEMIEAAHHYHNYVIYEDPEKGHLIQLLERERIIAMHPVWFEKHKDAKAAIDALFSALEGFRREDADSKVHVRKCSSSSHIIPVDKEFFPFNITVALPNWPARFYNPEFRKHMENTFRANTPAHININYVWLNVFEMRDFEKMYIDWLEVMKKHDGTDERYRFSQELIWMIRKYTGRDTK